jgi:hypothetical protein
MRLAPRLALLLLAVTACSVAPGEPSGPVDAWVIGTEPGGDPGLVVRHLEVEDVRTLESERLTPETGSRIDVLGTAVSVSDGEPLDIEVAVDDEGIVQALDRDGLLALSAVAHVQTAERHFAAAGIEQHAALRPYRLILFPGDVTTGLPTEDNAFYLRGTDLLVFAPDNRVEGLSLSASEGVVVHEYAHAAFDSIAHPLESEAWADPPILLAGLDEGLADVHAVAVTGDPLFLSRSVDASLVGDRDLRPARVMSEDRLVEIFTGQRAHYELGTALGSIFWWTHELRMAAGVPEEESRLGMARFAVETVARLPWSDDAAELDLADFFDAVVDVTAGSVPADALCARFAATFPSIHPEMESCR